MKSSALTSHQSRIHWQFTQYAQQVTAYSFDSAQHGADLFDLKVPGNIYSRIMNPTCAVLEQRVAALEGGIGALAVASGMSAISYAIQTIAEAGDNIGCRIVSTGRLESDSGSGNSIDTHAQAKS